MDPLAYRVAARFLAGKGVQLMPDFTKALHAFQEGNTLPMQTLVQRVIDIIMPGGKPPAWYYALGTAKRNALNWLQKEGHVLLMELKSIQHQVANEPDFDPRGIMWQHYEKRLTEWGKKLRTLEIASQAEDEERNIKHGPFTVVRMPGITQADVNGSLEALDAAADKIRSKFPQVLYGTVYLSTHLSSKTAAHYVYDDDTVHLSVNARKRFSDMQTLIHEFGHRFDHKFLHNKELRTLFWDLSTKTVMETVRYDEKLRRAVANEVIQIALARKNGTVMPVMSKDLERWVRSPWGVGPYIKTVIANFLSGKFDEAKVRSEVMGSQDRDIETGVVLHKPLHVTEYGGTKPSENFAEAFAFYVLGLPMPPELAEIMSQL
jgi:hypothetical protein